MHFTRTWCWQPDRRHSRTWPVMQLRSIEPPLRTVQRYPRCVIGEDYSRDRDDCEEARHEDFESHRRSHFSWSGPDIDGTRILGLIRVWPAVDHLFPCICSRVTADANFIHCERCRMASVKEAASGCVSTQRS